VSGRRPSRHRGAAAPRRSVFSIPLPASRGRRRARRPPRSPAAPPPARARRRRRRGAEPPRRPRANARSALQAFNPTSAGRAGGRRPARSTRAECPQPWRDCLLAHGLTAPTPHSLFLSYPTPRLGTPTPATTPRGAPPLAAQSPAHPLPPRAPARAATPRACKEKARVEQSGRADAAHVAEEAAVEAGVCQELTTHHLPIVRGGVPWLHLSVCETLLVWAHSLATQHHGANRRRTAAQPCYTDRPRHMHRVL
jgi:hypothetical protein